MSVLLLRLAGPMQSWGTQSRFTVRDTGLDPSKSGVVGLLCAALGRHRDEPVDDLAALRMGVRVDREGRVARDYNTAMDVIKADGSGQQTVVSQRYYLADADFLVGLEGELDTLRRLDEALAAPVWQLFLGRKSYVPSSTIRLPAEPPMGPGLREGPLLEVLATYPWPNTPAVRRAVDEDDLVRFVIESDGTTSSGVRQDQPVGAAFRDRSFTLRHVTTRFEDRPVETSTKEE